MVIFPRGPGRNSKTSELCKKCFKGTNMKGNKMAEMSLGMSDRNDPGNVKRADGRSNFVLDKRDRKALLKAKHLGRCDKQLFT
jgi:esterase/lipase superfamily enzyme